MLDDKGVHISDHFRRFTGRAVLDTKVKEWLHMSNSIMYTNSADKMAGSEPGYSECCPRNILLTYGIMKQIVIPLVRIPVSLSWMKV